MIPKKEHYRNKLPHFQQPGQWYSVTCILNGAMPKGAMAKYSSKLEAAKNRYLLLLDNYSCEFNEVLKNSGYFNVKNSTFAVARAAEISMAEKEYYIALKKYRLAYDKILNRATVLTVNLTKEKNRKIIEEALFYWEGKRIVNHSWCIMSNHIHWVLTVNKNDEKNIEVYLEDILQSVKRYTAREINKIENRSGKLWEHESFETTLRNQDHFFNAMNYTIQNPVSAGLVSNWKSWPGTWISEDWKMVFEADYF